MAKRENQKAKLLHLYKLLLERTDAERGLTLEEMASALEEVGIAAERKSLYDDLRVLRECGLDIEMHRGRAVTYHVVSRDFELPELKLLVDAVQSSKFITHKKSAELIKKLSALTSQREAQQLQRQVFVANRIKTMNESIYYTVDAVQDALAQGVQISFRYFSWNEKKEKDFHHGGERLTVSPWALVWDDENYYLIAYESESGRIKHYRVDKMLSVRALSEKRDGAEHFRDFDAAVYSKKTFGMFGGREETVRLRCTNDLAGVMLDRFGQDVIFVPDGEAHFTLSVRVSISPVFLAWVMSFGKKVSVLSPESVRGEVAAAAREVLAQYEGGRKMTGLVLEGGGVRGIYTAGVLDVFMEQGITFDGLMGVSAGAIHGCSYLSNQHGRSIRYYEKYCGDPRFMSFQSFLKTGDVVGVDFCYHELPDVLDPYDHEAFLRNETPFYAVCSNVETGEAEYLRIKDMRAEIDVLRASASLPYFSRIVDFGGKKYLDGGCTDSIPVDAMRALGYARCVVVLTREDTYRKKAEKRLLTQLVYRKYPAFAAALCRRHEVYNAQAARVRELERKGEVFVIRPEMPLGVGRMEKDTAKVRAAYERGRADALAQLDALRTFLKGE